MEDSNASSPPVPDQLSSDEEMSGEKVEDFNTAKSEKVSEYLLG
jgi:hypothetical protein